MATIYSPPFDAPEITRESVDTWLANEQAYLERIAAWCREQYPDDPLAGEVLRFPQGDGYAVYVVLSVNRTARLIHVPIGDRWSLPEAHERGLRVSDIRAEVAREKKLAELFGRSDEEETP
jgi:hypothetical protein